MPSLLRLVAFAALVYAAPLRHGLPISERTPVATLPVLAQEVEPGESQITALEGARIDRQIRTHLSARPDTRAIEMEPEAIARLLDLPTCRDSWSCLEPLLPTSAELILDARLTRRQGGLVLYVRLLDLPGASEYTETLFIPPAGEDVWTEEVISRLLDRRLGRAPW